MPSHSDALNAKYMDAQRMQTGSGCPRICHDLSTSWWQIIEKKPCTQDKPKTGAATMLKHHRVEPASKAALNLFFTISFIAKFGDRGISHKKAQNSQNLFEPFVPFCGYSPLFRLRFRAGSHSGHQ